MDSLASRLQAAREEKGWTQTQLAKAAGISQGTIGNIEAGIRGGAESLALIAEALGVRYRWLRDGDLPARTDAGQWPFEAFSLARFSALSDRQKGRVEQAALDALQQCEAESLPSKRQAA